MERSLWTTASGLDRTRKDNGSKGESIRPSFKDRSYRVERSTLLRERWRKSRSNAWWNREANPAAYSDGRLSFSANSRSIGSSCEGENPHRILDVLPWLLAYRYR